MGKFNNFSKIKGVLLFRSTNANCDVTHKFKSEARELNKVVS